MDDIVWLTTQSGQHISVFADAARALGHKSGARLTEAEVREAIGANARHGIRECERMLAERRSADPHPDDGESDG